MKPPKYMLNCSAIISAKITSFTLSGLTGFIENNIVKDDKDCDLADKFEVKFNKSKSSVFVVAS